MTGATTFDEASGMPLADVLNRYEALNDRDLMARSIATLKARGVKPADPALNPEDFPPLTTAEHLELLALGEALARHYRHPVLVHYAVRAGATWQQVAAAAGGDPDQARQAYRAWAEGQHRLRQDFPGGALGLGDEEYAAAAQAAGGPHAAPEPGDMAEDTRRLGAIGEVLDRFDWEADDRQLALEAIERIADGA
jgi:hypothetical protein